MEESNISPFFSIIIPLYNRRTRIDRAVHSVLSQTFTDWELIIVDDASTDSSWEHIQSYTDPRIRVLRNTINSERCITRNKGIALAKGKFICFLDSDDYHLPEHLHLLNTHILEKGQPEAMFFTNAWDENQQGQRGERMCPELEAHNLFHYILTYTFNPQRVAVHSKMLVEQKFDPAIPGLEDLDLWLRLAAKYPVFQIPVRSTVYVNHAEAYSSNALKYVMELQYFTHIFAKPELKHFLPKKSMNRLLSMCHFHMAQQAFVKNDFTNVRKHGIRSFVLYPSGYNGKTNIPLAVMLLYSMPILGALARAVNKVRNSNKPSDRS
jgi:glycosyltransferase involved in cell wall biosynthesis